MTMLNFDFSNVSPESPGGGSFLPISDDKGWLVILTGDNGFKPNSKNTGHYLELVGVGQDAQVSGQEFSLRFNLQHSEPKAVAAAVAELSALGHVLGLPGRINNTADLFNKPFRVVSEQQKGSEYTQLARNGIRDVNGNKPGGAAKGPQTAGAAAPGAGPAIPPQGGQPAQGGAPAGWGGAPQGQPPAQGGQWGGAPQQGQQQQQQQGWGGQPGQGQPPAQPAQGQPQQGGAPGGWGAPQGGPQGGPSWGPPQGGPQGGATAFGGQGGGAPSWAGGQ